MLAKAVAIFIVRDEEVDFQAKLLKVKRETSSVIKEDETTGKLSGWRNMIDKLTNAFKRLTHAYEGS